MGIEVVLGNRNSYLTVVVHKRWYLFYRPEMDDGPAESTAPLPKT